MQRKTGVIGILLTSVLAIAFVVGGYLYWEKRLIVKVNADSEVNRKVEMHKGKVISAGLLLNKQRPDWEDDELDEEAEEIIEEDINEIEEEESAADHYYTEQPAATNVNRDNTVQKNWNQSTSSSNKSSGQGKYTKPEGSNNTKKNVVPPKEEPSNPKEPAKENENPPAKVEKPKDPPKKPETPAEPAPEPEKPVEPAEPGEDKGNPEIPVVPVDPAEPAVPEEPEETDGSVAP